MKNKKSYKINPSKNPKNRFSKRNLGLLLALILILVAVFVIYKATRPDKQAISVIPSGNQEQVDQTDNSATPEAKNEDENEKSSGSSDNRPIVNLMSPSGTFVSSHTVSLSSPGVIESTCNSTPGAKCSISFTNKNGVVRYLPAKTVDKNNTAYWSWLAKDAKLTVGKWTISATATSGSQSKNTVDPKPLEVTP